ncbi:hypothetical protein DFP73DRAFT_200768 [Morchella snyderi]|nr:hypothetical protein DFP73DRAFT_200768 [Morchella snyderi]
MSTPTTSTPSTPHLHVHLDALTLQREQRPYRPTTSVYHRTPRSYRSTHSGMHSSQARTPTTTHSPRASVSTLQLQHLLEKLEMDQYNTYGVEELRDGFFDASFYRPIKQDTDDDDPRPLLSTHHTTLRQWGQSQLAEAKDVARLVFTTRKGVALGKSFLAYFAAYMLCLVPTTRAWLGPYSYWILIAALFNHPGRTVGAQIEGTVSCAAGGALGLGVGSLALSIATSSEVGYGGVLTVFIAVFIGAASWVRCSLVRVYQAMMSAGLAFFFLVLVDVRTVAREGTWERGRLRQWAVPWGVGLAVCAVVNVVIAPEAGGKAVATALHKALLSALDGLVLQRAYSPATRRHMSLQLVNLSEALRDMRSEIILSSLAPADGLQLRNLLQAVIRDIMAIKPDASLFDPPTPTPAPREDGAAIIDLSPAATAAAAITPGAAATATADTASDNDNLSLASSTADHLALVHSIMAAPTKALLAASADVLKSCDNTLMALLHHPELLRHAPSSSSSSSIARNSPTLTATHATFAAALRAFDAADSRLMEHPDLPGSYAAHPDLVRLFLFIHPVRQTAESILPLAAKVLELERTAVAAARKRVYLPSYPLSQALYRASPQVRHDRGGLTAGYYFKSKQRIDEAMARYHSLPFTPSPDILSAAAATASATAGAAPETPDPAAPATTTTRPGTTAEPETWRFKAWCVVHRLQQFESRFAVKVVLVTALLCVPAWAGASRRWYVANESWWSVVAAWFMMHPRVGGSARDLVTRSVAAAVGAAWGGVAVRAGAGSPVVVGVFMAVFMAACIFRFTASSHPRSGLMGCVAFSVVSVSAQTAAEATGSPAGAVRIAWTRGAALIVGIVSAVVVNWVIWPFVARHELRKSLSFMMLNLGISYRGVVARYIYYDADSAPTKEDLERSEMQEARLREGVSIPYITDILSTHTYAASSSTFHTASNSLPRILLPSSFLPIDPLSHLTLLHFTCSLLLLLLLLSEN